MLCTGAESNQTTHLDESVVDNACWTCPHMHKYLYFKLALYLAVNKQQNQ